MEQINEQMKEQMNEQMNEQMDATEKEINIAFSTINHLMPSSSCAFTSIPKWYYDPLVVKKLIQLHFEFSRNNAHSIAGVLPLLFYASSDEEGLKRILDQLSFEEQLYLFCPYFFPITYSFCPPIYPFTVFDFIPHYFFIPYI